MEFANALADSFLEICANSKEGGQNEAIYESIQDIQEDIPDFEKKPSYGTISYCLSNFPNAKPGYTFSFPHR